MNETMQSQTGQQPLLIWTFRRTGGTNLAQALFERSEFEGVQHEPFNSDRVFGQVTNDWLEKHDGVALDQAMQAICDRRVLMKHCVEMVPAEVNQALVKASVKQGYRHLFLYRRKPLDRLMSLHFASQSGVWGKNQAQDKSIDDAIFAQPLPVQKLVRHEQQCRAELRRIYEQLLAHGQAPLALSFEDLYTSDDTSEAERQVMATLQALGLQTGGEQDRTFVHDVLVRGDQGTREHYKRFTDHDKLAHELSVLGDFDVRAPSALSVTYADEPQTEVAKCVVWEPRADVLAHAWLLTGAVVLDASVAPGCSLQIKHGAGVSAVSWHLASPRMATLFPNNPQAASARFSVGNVHIQDDSPAQLLLQRPDGTVLPLAYVSVAR